MLLTCGGLLDCLSAASLQHPIHNSCQAAVSARLTHEAWGMTSSSSHHIISLHVPLPLHRHYAS